MIELTAGVRVFTENGSRIEMCGAANEYVLLIDSRSTPLGVWSAVRCYAEIGKPLEVQINQKEGGSVLLTELGNVVNMLRLGSF